MGGAADADAEDDDAADDGAPVDDEPASEEGAGELAGGCNAAVGADVPFAAGGSAASVLLSPHALNAASASAHTPTCPSASTRLFSFATIRPPRILASDEAKRIRAREDRGGSASPPRGGFAIPSWLEWLRGLCRNGSAGRICLKRLNIV